MTALFSNGPEKMKWKTLNYFRDNAYTVQFNKSSFCKRSSYKVFIVLCPENLDTVIT